MFTKITRMQRF